VLAYIRKCVYMQTILRKEMTDDPRSHGIGIRWFHGAGFGGADPVRLAAFRLADHFRRRQPAPGRLHRLLPGSLCLQAGRSEAWLRLLTGRDGVRRMFVAAALLAAVPALAADRIT